LYFIKGLVVQRKKKKATKSIIVYNSTKYGCIHSSNFF
jgi:hypothetical protein